MTGPGEGKIPLRSRVYIAARGSRVELMCDVYLHVKGYSRARVTHLDLEAEAINALFPPGASKYLPIVVEGNELRLKLGEVVYVRELRAPAREIVIECPLLAKALGALRSVAYVGGKVGGIYLGFKKPVVRKLEELAVSMGVKPR
ncbi:MAG: hypothetical protein DRK00_04595 [Thermoprotei archaeon]|nr:MAG: hypothetical protein DRK00_04595 [Thermoprotei archaeon]